MAYEITMVITLLSTFLGVLFSIRAVTKDKGGEAALYLLARSAVLFLAAVFLLFVRFSSLLALITAVMLVIQLIDGFVGIHLKNRQRIIGPFLLAVLHGVCLFILY